MTAARCRAASCAWTLKPFSARAARLKAPVLGGFSLNPSEHQRRSKRASSRSRQQRRPGPEGAQKEDAARGHFPRDETPRPLRKTIGKEGAEKGGGAPPGPQARAQEDAARRSVACQAASRSRRWLGARRPPWARQARRRLCV